jgi:exodeoxyribonuclease V beta subunit
VLAAVGGERRLTDLRHVAQLLHAAATREQLGTAALTAWLRRRIAAAAEETGDEERSRRLESDAEAVQVLTIHRSKGLEFPVVYFPFLWEPGYIPPGGPVAYHDREAGDERTVDVGLEGRAFAAHALQHRAEQRGEDLRLAYVALTRAQHQAVVWWAGTRDSRDSALGRLLFARDASGNVAPAGTATPTDAAALERFEALAADAPGCFSVERSEVVGPARWERAPQFAAALTAGRFDRTLDRDWRRTSYTDLTADAHEARVASEPEEPVVSDEPAAPPAGAGPAVAAPPAVGASLAAVASPPAGGPLAAPSLLAAMPAGVDVGTFVHRVLEATDFAAPDLGAELAAHVAGARVAIGDPAAVVEGLRAAIETPLGPLLDGTRLRDLGRADRLDELTFELPLAGGDVPAGTFAPAALAPLLREHLTPDDPLHGYAGRLEELGDGVRGYLTGTIDLVARVGGAFAIVDYKTNWLAPPGEPLTAWHHRPAALVAEMQRAHYGLQALLYTAALHRYLRWRLSDYDPDRHLAGVLYLFLRGMSGPATPVIDGTPCGVFAWRPPAALVGALSDLLERGAAPAAPTDVVERGAAPAAPTDLGEGGT